MQQSWLDEIWSMMETGKYYSIRDLANLTDQPNTSITDSMRFLSKYGFVRSFGQLEIFTKTGKLSPAKSAQLLTRMLQPSVRTSTST
ncbi:MAG: hypothetical protein ABSA92_07920 [Candidatus Bathyarchaeia archaeon]